MSRRFTLVFAAIVMGASLDEGGCDCGSPPSPPTPPPASCDHATCEGFCGSVANACVPLSFASLCADTRYTLIIDGYDTDDAAGRSLRSTLMARCPAASVNESTMSDTSYIASPSFLPRVGPGHMLLMSGGSFYHKVVEALAPYAPVDEASVITEEQAATLSDTHDFFVIELVKDPSNTVSLITYGMYDKGTVAAAFYFPSIPTTSTASYIVGEWTNTDSDPEPSAGDTFTVIRSGH